MPKLVQIILCLLFWIFVLIPLLFIPAILLVCLYFYRKIIDFIVTNWLHPNWKPILPPDCVFGGASHKRYATPYHKDKCFGNFGSMIVFPGKIPLEEFRERFQARFRLWKPNGIAWNAEEAKSLLSFDKCSMTPVKCFGYYYWAPNFVDIKDQVWEYDCNKTGAEDEFEEFLTRWIASPFKAKYIFEAVLASPLKGNFAGQTVLVLKGSHVLLDGMSGIHCFYEGMFGKDKFPENLKMPLVKATWGQVLYQTIVFPKFLLQMSRLKKVPNLSEFLYKDTPPPPDGWKTIFASSSIPLSSVKLVKRSLNIPFREVLTCTFMSAVRKLILQEDPNTELPEHISCLTAMPWVYSPRPSDQIFSNNATANLFLYPIKLENPVERMRLAHKSCRQNLINGMHRVNFYSTNLNYILPAWIADSSLFTHISVTVNTVDMLARVDPEELYLDKYQAYSTFLGTVALPPVGKLLGKDLVLVFITNERTEEISVSLTANSKLIGTIEKAQLLCKYFQMELEELVQIVQNEQKTGDTDKRKYVPESAGESIV